MVESAGASVAGAAWQAETQNRQKGWTSDWLWRTRGGGTKMVAVGNPHATEWTTPYEPRVDAPLKNGASAKWHLRCSGTPQARPVMN